MRLHNNHLALARYQSTVLLSVAHVELVAEHAERSASSASARMVAHVARDASVDTDAELAQVAIVATVGIEMDENPFAALAAALAATDEREET